MVIGRDIIRALGRKHDSETFHLVVSRKAFDLEELAACLLTFTPPQAVDPLIGFGRQRVIDLTIIFEPTVVNLLHPFDQQHHIFGRIPGVHQHRAKGQLLVFNGVGQHLLQLIKLRFAIAIGVINAIINDPKLVGLGVDINAGDDADAFDDVVGIATVLAAHQVNLEGVVLIQDRVIEDDIALGTQHEVWANWFPQQARLNAVIGKIAIDGMARKLLAVLSKVGQGVIDLTTEQILTIVEARHSSWLLSHNYDFTQFPRPLSFQRIFCA